MPFSKEENARFYFGQMQAALRRHPKATIIWAHTGLGRVVQPHGRHIAFLEEILSDPGCAHVNFDISWDEVAKYVTHDDKTVAATAALINKYPDRFLFGTDVVGPKDAEHYFAVYNDYLHSPLWAALTPEAREKVLKANYVRIFDAARRKVRAWEAANLSPATQAP